jgi:hypothetical protein
MELKVDQGRIQDFKLGGAHVKNVGGISCEKSRFYAKKIMDPAL